MYRLIYASQFTALYPHEREEQHYALNAIIRASSRNNRAAGITALLLTHRRQALQVLEGPQEAVTAAYARILKDPRHTAARPISQEPIAARAFGDWGLLTLRVEDGDSAIADRLDGAGLTLGDLSADDALALLSEVRDAQARDLLAAMA